MQQGKWFELQKAVIGTYIKTKSKNMYNLKKQKHVSSKDLLFTFQVWKQRKGIKIREYPHTITVKIKNILLGQTIGPGGYQFMKKT